MADEAEPLLISVRDAAKLTGLSRYVITQLCETGDLESGFVNRRRMVGRDSVTTYYKRLMAQATEAS